MLVLAIVLAAGALASVLVLTVKRWLLPILNVLDRLLTRIGFGTWSARCLTKAENWVSQKVARKAPRV
jgi:hypothetical protein